MEALSFATAMVVLPWKMYFARPRPSQLETKLDPPISVPAHYSYPSGHSTQAFVIALALSDLFDKQSSIGIRAKKEAYEVAVNREWAGVHYESDSIAGRMMAEKIWAKAKSDSFSHLFESAAQEWPHLATQK